MGVARQASTAATRRLMGELKAQGKEKGEDAFDKRFAVAKELKIGRFIMEIDGKGSLKNNLNSFSRCCAMLFYDTHT
jgi:hypothetical protein